MIDLNCKKFGMHCLVAALVATVLFSRASAQSLLEPPQRWLLVFETSIAMKNCLPATAVEVQNIFISGMSSQLRLADSVGVWTFGKKLRTGDYPLFAWVPRMAASDATDLINFLDRQHYLDSARFGVLRPALKQVIAHSQRLTIVIFCDGLDDFKLTPYDDGINQTFKQLKDGRNKMQQPFVVVVRTQNGEFVGATVNLPPGNLDFPPFPPLPQDLQAAPPNSPSPPAVVVPPPPVIVQPPLVIVGTNVITNTNELEKTSGP
jgi:hypothetical protein